jgi:hypothetical protein
VWRGWGIRTVYGIQKEKGGGVLPRVLNEKSGCAVCLWLEHGHPLRLVHNQEGCIMKCERCGARMLEEHVAVSGGVVKVKNLSVWHCTQCNREEYRAMVNVATAVTPASQMGCSG